MKSEAYLAINPMGKVPAIVHRGRIVTECAAICAYLAEAFPEAGLAPSDNERADYYRWLFFAAGPLEHAITNNNASFIPSAEQSRSFGYGSYDQAVETLAGAVSAQPYIAGDRFTAADVYVGSAVTWGLMFGTLPKLDAFVRYSERVTDREAYRRGKDKDNALMPQAAPA
jgi:glutathione S-transferase